MIFVLDSAAVLAVIRGEPGADKVLAYSEGAIMSAVNVAETVTKCIEKDYPEGVALEVIHSCGIIVVAFGEEHAVLAGQLRRNAPKGVLSLGDRACIATAMLQGGVAVTADRIWTTLELPCPVELIR